MQNSPVSKDDSLKVVGNVKVVHIHTIRIVNLLNFQVHFNIRKKSMQNVVYISNERNWSLLFLLRRRVFIRFCLFFVLFLIFFGIVSFVTTTFDKIQFPSQVRLSKINRVLLILLKFKLDAVLIEWGGSINFLFVGRQDTVNYWDFPSKISRNYKKGWYRKLLDMINAKCL